MESTIFSLSIILFIALVISAYLLHGWIASKRSRITVYKKLLLPNLFGGIIGGAVVAVGLSLAELNPPDFIPALLTLSIGMLLLIFISMVALSKK